MICVSLCVSVCVSGLSDDGALCLAAHMSRLRAQLTVQANKRYTVCATLYARTHTHFTELEAFMNRMNSTKVQNPRRNY